MTAPAGPGLIGGVRRAQEEEALASSELQTQIQAAPKLRPLAPPSPTFLLIGLDFAVGLGS